jgi:hypothetical protein
MWRKPLSIRTTDFLIKKDNLSRTKFIEGEIDLNELKSGQVLCLVDKFAFTTNNITYAMLGNSRLRYWQFFPASEDGWGKLPVWGYADVIHSYHEEIAEGERLFGYFPLATHLVIEADKATPFNFVDSAAHRRELSPIYNQYSRTGQKGAHEGLQALFRPLFITSFLIDDFLADNGFFGGQTVVISSASRPGVIFPAIVPCVAPVKEGSVPFRPCQVSWASTAKTRASLKSLLMPIASWLITLTGARKLSNIPTSVGL